MLAFGLEAWVSCTSHAKFTSNTVQMGNMPELFWQLHRPDDQQEEGFVPTSELMRAILGVGLIRAHGAVLLRHRPSWSSWRVALPQSAVICYSSVLLICLALTWT
jgi:hypothetical protein